ncbi:unannotated protein [freshwater metagenome]|uniref:Unannotated protein n=1 Tax=freshwater metagenome TaxID=449393 RepID=A0A6J7RE50_9ZZZZ
MHNVVELINGGVEESPDDDLPGEHHSSIDATKARYAGIYKFLSVPGIGDIDLAVDYLDGCSKSLKLCN